MNYVFAFTCSNISNIYKSWAAGFVFGLRPANDAGGNSACMYTVSVIGLQMASAYVGSTFMPMVFGNLQQHIGIGIMPVYLLIFAVMNIGLLERTYVILKKQGV